MEILATVEHKTFFMIALILMIIVTLLFLALSIIGIYFLFKDGFDFNGIMATIVCLGVFSLFGFEFYYTYNDGAQVEYKAKITDFNQVYKNGYEITGKEGKIYTLEKK